MNNYTLLKKIFIILILISIMYAFFSNSSSSKKLDNMAYIVAVGIEKGSVEKYKMSFELSTVKSSSSDSSSDSKKESNNGSSQNSSSSEDSSPYTVYSVECDSVDTGISLLNTYINKKINLSHCKIIVISEDLAKEGIRSIVYNFVNKIEIRPDCNIIISQTPGDEFSQNKKPSLEDVLTQYFEISSNTDDNDTDYTKIVTLNEFYSALEDPLKQPYAALGIINNANSSADDSNNKDIEIDKSVGTITSKKDKYLVELIGVSVFNDDRMVGKLSSIETVCHLALIDNLNQSTISLPSPFDSKDKINLFISVTRKPKIKVYIDKNSPTPFVKIDLKIIGRLVSFNNTEKTIDQDIIHQMENKANEYITKQIYNYLYKSSKEFKSDISGIGLNASINFSTYQELEKYNWLKNYENCAFQVNVQTSIKSGYFLTNK